MDNIYLGKKLPITSDVADVPRRRPFSVIAAPFTTEEEMMICSYTVQFSSLSLSRPESFSANGTHCNNVHILQVRF